MGADQLENTFICPYCCKRIKCEGFQEIVNLKDTRWAIYRHVDHTEHVSHVGEAGKSIRTPQDTFILHNPKNVTMVSPDLLPQLDQKKIPCPRCRQKIDEAQKLFKKGLSIDSTDVLRICDHCFLKSQTQEKCYKCKNKKIFLAARREQQKYSNKYNKRWVTKMENVLNKIISEVKTQKKTRRTYSEIDINLLNRDTSGSVIKCTVQEMFHSELNLLDTNRLEKVRHPKKQVLAVEKTVNFTGLTDTFQTLSSESNINITVENQDRINVYNADSRLGPRSSGEEEKYHRGMVETSQAEETTEQIQKDYERSIPFETEKIIDSDLEQITSFFFPESFQNPDTKLKINLSSSELIKDTQEKIVLKAKEKELKMIEKLRLKSELEEKKKLAREEKERLNKESIKMNQEGLIKLKSSDITSKMKRTDSVEQSGKMQKGGFEEEPEEKRETTQPKGKDISTSLVQKGKVKKGGLEEEPGEKQATTQSKGKDKSPFLEQNNKLRKGGFEEATKEKQETIYSKKKDTSASLEEKSKMKKDGLKKEPEEKQTQSKGKDKPGEPTKTERLKEKEMKAGEPKQTESLKEKELKPVELKKTERLKEKELKIAEVKLQKQSIDKLDAKIKLNESEKNQSAIKSKKQEEINKVPDISKKYISKDDGHEGKRDALQTTDKKKSEKSNKEEQQEKDLKMTQVKLVKASADDLVSQLPKFNKNVPSKHQDKAPELSKMLLESAKRKEALVDKSPRFEEPKKKDGKSVLPSTKETKEKELKMNQVKLVDQAHDDIILKLIRVRSPSEHGKKSMKKKIAGVKKKKVDEDESNLELNQDENSSDEIMSEELPQLKDGTRSRPLKIHPPHREGQDIIPMYIQHELSEISSTAPLGDVKDAIIIIEDQKKVDPEAGKGIIRYALSDRTFIEKGWTMLPVEKVVRKMNIYRMRPAQPEFDWFEHNKHKGLMLYDTGTKLAEFDKDGRGRWFYQNGRLALDYYEAEETNTQQRFVVYSNGEQDERGRSRPVTILATFDHLGNGVVFDHAGKIRLKFNQTEGVLLDRSIGPASNWKWHTLNDPPVLQQVMIDTQMPLKDPKILKLGGPADNRTRPDNEEMLAIEFDNFIKEKSKKLTQKFKPFQIKMKALKINENFSLKVLDQATIYLIFRDGSANLKVNIGMILDHKEIVDTDTAELGEVSNSLERLPARTDSLAALQRSVAYARRYERMRTERERRLRHPEPCLSADELGKAASRPLQPPLRILPTSTGSSTEHCKCSKKQSSTLYYNTQLL